MSIVFTAMSLGQYLALSTHSVHICKCGGDREGIQGAWQPGHSQAWGGSQRAKAAAVG